MRKNMKSLFALLLGSIALSFWACNPLDNYAGIDRGNLDAEFAVPIGQMELKMQDLLEGKNPDQITVDADGLIRLHYQGDLLTRTSEQIFDAIETSLAFPIPIDSTPFLLPLSAPDGLEIYRLDLRSGTMQFTTVNTTGDFIQLHIELPQVLDENMQVVKLDYLVPDLGGTPWFSDIIDMTNYTIDAPSSEVYVEYTATLLSSGDSLELAPFLIQLSQVEFSYAEGYFANQLHDNGLDTIDIDLFDTWLEGDVYFEDPLIHIFVYNSFGVPTRSIVQVFEVHTALGQILPLESPYIDNGIDFEYPDINHVGETAVTHFIFDKGNSNIDDILGSEPTQLVYEVDAITNPDNDTAIVGYITDSSQYTVTVAVELPLYGTASNFKVRDTLDWDASALANAQEMELKIITDNGFPLEAKMDLLFLDEQNQVIATVFDKPELLMAAAPVNADGFPTDVEQTVTLIPLSGDLLANARQADKIALLLSFSTSMQDGSQPPVKITDEQEMNIKLGLKFK